VFVEGHGRQVGALADLVRIDRNSADLVSYVIEYDGFDLARLLRLDVIFDAILHFLHFSVHLHSNLALG
jgi:hypothetical protein